MIDFPSIMFTIAITTFVTNIVIASYGIFVKRSLIKKIISLIIFSDSVNIIAIFLGFRITENRYSSPPILSEIPDEFKDIEFFISTAVDPLPQAFVLTAIVIGLAIIMFLLGLMLIYYHHFETTDILFKEEEYEEDI